MVSGCIFQLPNGRFINSNQIISIDPKEKDGKIENVITWGRYECTTFSDDKNWGKVWVDAKCGGWQWTDGRTFRLRK